MVDRAYRTSGMSGLIKGPYPGKQPRLNADQQKQLAQIIEAGPEKAGLDTGVWSAVIVKSLIKTRFGVSYGLSQVRRILRKLRFSVQVPRRVPSREDPDEQKEWIEKDLPEIEKEVRSDGGVSLYQDEASFQQSGTLTHTWCYKGKGCEVKSFPTRAYQSLRRHQDRQRRSTMALPVRERQVQRRFFHCTARSTDSLL